MKKSLYQFSVSSLVYFSLMAAYVAGKAIMFSPPTAQLAMGNQ